MFLPKLILCKKILFHSILPTIKWTVDPCDALLIFNFQSVTWIYSLTVYVVGVWNMYQTLKCCLQWFISIMANFFFSINLLVSFWDYSIFNCFWREEAWYSIITELVILFFLVFKTFPCHRISGVWEYFFSDNIYLLSIFRYSRLE